MKEPLEITYSRTAPTDELNGLIRKEVAKLEKAHPHVLGCHVFVEAPEKDEKQKRDRPHWRVRIELALEKETLVGLRHPSPQHRPDNVAPAIEDAFEDLRHLLEDLAREEHKDMQRPHARVVRIFADQGYGTLRTHDGREINFHRESVLHGGFDQLQAGDEVRFVEELGARGPEAAHVQKVHGEGHHEEAPIT